jgi:hypothetical protein
MYFVILNDKLKFSVTIFSNIFGENDEKYKITIFTIFKKNDKSQNFKKRKIKN